MRLGPLLAQPSIWLLASMLALGLAACSDDPGPTEPTRDAGIFEDGGPPEARPDAGPGDPPDEEPFAPDRVGGALTLEASVYGDTPFLTIPPTIDLTKEPTYSIGRELYRADWFAPKPGHFHVLDGLGPLFNATACLSCHPAAGRPRSLTDEGEVLFGVLIRLASVDGGKHPKLGGQLQPLSLHGVPSEGKVSWVKAPDPTDFAYLKIHKIAPKPLFRIDPEPSPKALLGPRNSPQLAGVGLLDRVPESVIAEYADPDDSDRNGISGRIARPKGPNGPMGRFGWKAITVSVTEQAAAAFNGDMGITSPLFPKDDCTESQSVCRDQPNGGEPEISQNGLEAVSGFLALQGVPAARRTPGDPAMAKGQALMRDVGCTQCHRETLSTGEDPREPLSKQVFHPYTDLLLHDMGPQLAGEMPEGDAKPEEWRTPPLWGVGIIEKQGDGRFLHDGRAHSIEEAVRWHGGEAATALANFVSLTKEESKLLLDFVRSL